MFDFELKRMACVSTAHITREDVELLEEWAKDGAKDSPVLVAEYQYGFFLYVWEDDETDEKFSESMLAILENCRKMRCWYLQLDADGPKYEELKEHDW